MRHASRSPVYETIARIARIAESPRTLAACFAAIGSIAAAPNVALSSDSILMPETATSAATPLPAVPAKSEQKPDLTDIKGGLKIPRVIAPYANDASGYIIGNLTGTGNTSDTFVYSGIKEKDMHKRIWKYGRMIHLGQPTDDEPGWVKANDLKGINVRFSKNIDAEKIEPLAKRDNIGTKFNCAEHSCDDGKFFRTDTANLVSTAKLVALNYDEQLGQSYDYLPIEIPGSAYYRYSSNDLNKKWSRIEISTDDNIAALSVWGPLPSSVSNTTPEGGPPLITWEEMQQKDR